MFAKKYSRISKKWLPGKVTSVAQRSVKVKLASGLVIHCHFNQACKRTVDKPPVESVSESDLEAYIYISVNSDEPVVSKTTSSPDAPAVTQLPHNCRYPFRIRRPPDQCSRLN